MTFPATLVREYTLTTRPTASSVPTGTVIRLTNVGINGSLWVSNGSVWVAADSHIRMLGLTVGVVLPSLIAANLATYSQVGTTITVDNTVAHNIPAATFNGDSVYLKPSTGALVEGVYSNFQRTGANTFTCESTISQTISGNLATNTSIATLATLVIPAGVMGATGRIETNIQAQYLNSANNKTIACAFGGTNYYNNAFTTSGRVSFVAGMRNKNATNAQQAVNIDAATGLGSTTGTLTTAAVDTIAAVNVTLTGTVAAANEFLVIEHCAFNLIPGTLT